MCADMYRPQRRCSGCDSCCQENLWGEPERIYYIINPLWENEDDAVVLIDASNAFNSLTGRQRFTTFSSNLYQPSARLFVQGGAEISSTEVTTQSGPESMATHAIATVSLLNKRSWNQPNNLIIQRETHVAYADDAVGAGKMSHLRIWWDAICEYGPHFGYFINAKKSWITIKPRMKVEAEQAFLGAGINITTDC